MPYKLNESYRLTYDHQMDGRRIRSELKAKKSSKLLSNLEQDNGISSSCYFSYPQLNTERPKWTKRDLFVPRRDTTYFRRKLFVVSQPSIWSTDQNYELCWRAIPQNIFCEYIFKTFQIGILNYIRESRDYFNNRIIVKALGLDTI